MKNQFKHPLEEVVLDLMREHGAMDASKLAPLLSGSNSHGVEQYKVVASDVLEVLFKQGKTLKDKEEWSHIAPKPGGDEVAGFAVGQVWKNNTNDSHSVIFEVDGDLIGSVFVCQGDPRHGDIDWVDYEDFLAYHTLSSPGALMEVEPSDF